MLQALLALSTAHELVAKAKALAAAEPAPGAGAPEQAATGPPLDEATAELLQLEGQVRARPARSALACARSCKPGLTLGRPLRPRAHARCC